MPVPYAERRQRRRQLAESLPVGLRGWIALRHVETVAKFSPETQERLAEVIAAGVRVPTAIRILKEHPGATVADIVSQSQKATPSDEPEKSSAADLRDLIFLGDLLQSCFPDMPRATAEAMARSDLLREVLEMIRAERICLGSPHAQSDFVVVVLCGLALQTIAQLKQIIPRRTIYHQALQQSGVEWPF